MDRYSPIYRSDALGVMSRTSSVYSQQSDTQASFAEPPRSSSGTKSRVASHAYTPSFMSHHATKSTERLATPTSSSIPPATPHSNGHRVSRKPVRSPTRPHSDAPHQSPHSPLTQATSGVLLVLIAATIPSATVSYLEMLVERQKFSTLAIVASTAQESIVKQLKMDVYAIIGRMGKEMAVLIHTRDEWSQSGIESIIQEMTKNGDGIQGVLCCPEFKGAGAAALSMLETSEDELLQSWKQSTAFLHASIRASTNALLSRCSPERSMGGVFVRSPQTPFFLVTGSIASTAASQVTKTACDNLVFQFEIATRPQGLTVGYADSILVPDPKVVIPARDDKFLQPDTFNDHQQDQEFTPSESPTRLWNIWALRNEYSDN